MSHLIYIQRPKPDPLDILNVRLKKELHFDEVNKQTGFRTELVKELIEAVKKQREQC